MIKDEEIREMFLMLTRKVNNLAGGFVEMEAEISALREDADELKAVQVCE